MAIREAQNKDRCDIREYINQPNDSDLSANDYRLILDLYQCPGWNFCLGTKKPAGAGFSITASSAADQ
jgi:hypothetical protein